ncbi:aminotransferase class V-fold PLP-dependent enzyme [Anaeromyxobacter oryzae]|uniref:Aminotransferase n=1 Tax=Anaeromyxobacter oryzae TaxID=2918170 RepID=A0ABN6MSI5_9BACT|nr:aminotransferase class V-fold PLP-dependent enzyme [Anaeromyxobacter oryzae]BDG03496.1 aminotransferase [Anaeromyxobacter oryzae]
MSASPFADRFAPSEGIAYLDAASQGPIPLAASRAGRDALRLKEQPWRITSATYVSAVAEARALAARLLGAREEAVALVTGAGQIVNVAARGLDLGEGDEVLLARHEFPSNDFPWRWLARRGVRIRVAEPDHPVGAVSPERLAAEVGPRTRVVAFAHVSFLHGGRIDPGPVVEAARRVGALTVVDGSQAAGALPFDFGASGIDVYAASGYKFLLGPYGTGLGLFSPLALDRLHVGDVNWWSVVGAEDFNHLPAGIELRPGAQRYDAHETAAFFNLLPLAESLRFLLEVTPAAVSAHARALGDRLLARLPAGWEAASPLEPGARSHILCVRAATPALTAAAHDALREAKVATALRGDRIRVSPHLYSSAEDVDRLVAALPARR